MSILSVTQVSHILLCKRDPLYRHEKSNIECAIVLAGAYGVTVDTIHDIWDGCEWVGSRCVIKPNIPAPRRPMHHGNQMRQLFSVFSVDDVLFEWDEYPWRKLGLEAFRDPFAEDFSRIEFGDDVYI